MILFKVHAIQKFYKVFVLWLTLAYIICKVLNPEVQKLILNSQKVCIVKSVKWICSEVSDREMLKVINTKMETNISALKRPLFATKSNKTIRKREVQSLSRNIKERQLSMNTNSLDSILSKLAPETLYKVSEAALQKVKSKRTTKRSYLSMPMGNKESDEIMEIEDSDNGNDSSLSDIFDTTIIYRKYDKERPNENTLSHSSQQGPKLTHTNANVNKAETSSIEKQATTLAKPNIENTKIINNQGNNTEKDALTNFMRAEIINNNSAAKDRPKTINDFNQHQNKNIQNHKDDNERDTRDKEEIYAEILERDTSRTQEDEHVYIKKRKRDGDKSKEEDISNNEETDGKSSSPSNKATPIYKGKYKTQLPPFIVHNIKVNVVANLLLKKINFQSFIFKNLALNKFAIYVQKYVDFQLVLNLLKENNIEFHTKAPIEEKIFSWILKGVAGDFDEEDIKTEIDALKLKNVEIKSIRKINLKEFFKAKKGKDAFLIGISSNSNSIELTNISRLANQIVWWEKIFHKNPQQCFNCQRIGHTSKYCFRKYRCVK